MAHKLRNIVNFVNLFTLQNYRSLMVCESETTRIRKREGSKYLGV